MPRVEVNFGIGEGLTAASNDLVAKPILGYFLNPPSPSLAAAPSAATATHQ